MLVVSCLYKVILFFRFVIFKVPLYSNSFSDCTFLRSLYIAIPFFRVIFKILFQSFFFFSVFICKLPLYSNSVFRTVCKIPLCSTSFFFFFRLFFESQVFVFFGKLKNARYKVFDSFRKATSGE